MKIRQRSPQNSKNIVHSNSKEKESNSTIKKEFSSQFHCEICENEYSNPHILKIHIESVHEGQKPFICDLCGTNFTAKGKLKSHILTVHDKTTIYKCEICDTQFSTKEILTKHLDSQFMKVEGLSVVICVFQNSR